MYQIKKMNPLLGNLMYKKLIIIVVLLLTLTISACGGAKQEALATSQAEAIITAASGTAAAMQTEFAIQNPTATITFTPLPTQTELATATLLPTIPPALPTSAGGGSSGTVCNQAGFLAETIPDDTVFAPGTSFTKVWEISNTGTCAWTTAYTIVFHSEQQFGAPASNVIAGVNVNPGETVQISLEMVAPSEPGTYFSHWVLMNALGETFQIGGTTLWAKIVVSGDAATATPGGSPEPTVTETLQGTPITEITETFTPEPTQTPIIIVVTATYTPIPTDTPVP